MGEVDKELIAVVTVPQVLQGGRRRSMQMLGTNAWEYRYRIYKHRP